jgi:hypothetical protein
MPIKGFASRREIDRELSHVHRSHLDPANVAVEYVFASGDDHYRTQRRLVANTAVAVARSNSRTDLAGPPPGNLRDVPLPRPAHSTWRRAAHRVLAVTTGQSRERPKRSDQDDHRTSEWR